MNCISQCYTSIYGMWGKQHLKHPTAPGRSGVYKKHRVMLAKPSGLSNQAQGSGGGTCSHLCLQGEKLCFPSTVLTSTLVLLLAPRKPSKPSCCLKIVGADHLGNLCFLYPCRSGTLCKYLSFAAQSSLRKL